MTSSSQAECPSSIGRRWPRTGLAATLFCSRQRCIHLTDALPAAGDTESELNGIIAECRFLMREVAYASACLTYDPKDRIEYLTSAQNMALTGAKVGETVAKLRAGGAQIVETRRHELVYTHVQAAALQASHPLPPTLAVETDKQ